MRGTTEAASVTEVENLLWLNDYYIVRIRQATPAINWREQLPSLFGVKIQEVILFTRQLAVLLRSGISLIRAMTLLSSQVSNPLFRDDLDAIMKKVEGGSPLSEALAEYPLVFPEIYSRLVEVGERTGNLDQVLEQLADYLEKRESIVGRVRGALTYPLFLIAMAIGVVIILVNFALPGITGIFKEFGTELPWTTRLLLSITDFARSYSGVVLGVLVGSAALFFVYQRTPDGQRTLHRLVLKLPLVGDIIIKGALASNTRSIAMLLRAGVPLPDIMDLTTTSIGNVALKQAFHDVREALLQGRGLASPMEQNPLFPRLACQMIRVGEETGSLDVVLDTLSEFYEKDVDRVITQLTGMIQPTLILVMGGIVAFIALSVITPMYSIIGSVH